MSFPPARIHSTGTRRASMRRVFLGGIASGGACLLLLGCQQVEPPSTPTPETSATSTLDWGGCEPLIDGVRKAVKEAGAEGKSPLKAADRLECATISLPLDYSKPDGRHIDIALSRLPATDDSAPERYVFTNPGGPGLQGTPMPLYLADSGMSALSDSATLIGMDVRGTGASESTECPSDVTPEAPEDIPNASEEHAVEYAKEVVKFSAACVKSDPDLYRNVTVQNAARDIDEVRKALGADKIDYFGGSWGTALGLEYQSAFPEHVENMLLDSVVDTDPHLDHTLDGLAASYEANGIPGASSGGGASEGSGPIFKLMSSTARMMLSCNATEVPSVEQQWENYQQRLARYPFLTTTALGTPGSSAVNGISDCTDWPMKPTGIRAEAHDVSLQLVGHRTETVTPLAFAEAAQQQTGGHLYIMEDGIHAGLQSSTRAADAVAFLLDGTYLQ